MILFLSKLGGDWCGWKNKKAQTTLMGYVRTGILVLPQSQTEHRNIDELPSNVASDNKLDMLTGAWYSVKCYVILSLPSCLISQQHQPNVHYGSSIPRILH